MMRSSVVVGLCSLFLALSSPMGVLAQAPEQQMQDEIEALKEGQEQIQKDLQEIKKLLQTRAPAQPSGPNVKDKVFDLGDNPVKGEAAAKLTLVEFTDYQ